jgi:hypothetical protein
MDFRRPGSWRQPLTTTIALISHCSRSLRRPIWLILSYQSPSAFPVFPVSSFAPADSHNTVPPAILCTGPNDRYVLSGHLPFIVPLPFRLCLTRSSCSRFLPFADADGRSQRLGHSAHPPVLHPCVSVASLHPHGLGPHYQALYLPLHSGKVKFTSSNIADRLGTILTSFPKARCTRLSRVQMAR